MHSVLRSCPPSSSTLSDRIVNVAARPSSLEGIDENRLPVRATFEPDSIEESLAANSISHARWQCNYRTDVKWQSILARPSAFNCMCCRTKPTDEVKFFPFEQFLGRSLHSFWETSVTCVKERMERRRIRRSRDLFVLYFFLTLGIINTLHLYHVKLPILE